MSETGNFLSSVNLPSTGAFSLGAMGTQTKPQTLTTSQIQPSMGQGSLAYSPQTEASPGINPVSMTRDFLQGVARVGGSAALTLANKPELPIDPTASNVEKFFQSTMFGNESIKSFATRIAGGEQTAQGMGAGKFSLPLAFAGVLGGDALNFLGGEGEAGKFVESLAAESNVGKVTDSLVKKGFAKDIAETYAPKIAATTDKQVVHDAINKATQLQLGTKATKVAENTPSVGKSIQDLIDKKIPAQALGTVLKQKFPNEEGVTIEKVADQAGILAENGQNHQQILDYINSELTTDIGKEVSATNGASRLSTDSFPKEPLGQKTPESTKGVSESGGSPSHISESPKEVSSYPDSISGEPNNVKDVMTPERLKGLPTINTDEASKLTAYADSVAGDLKKAGFKGFTSDLKGAFQDWVNYRKAAKVEGFLKGKEFSALDKAGQQGIFDFQNGTTAATEKLSKYFDAKYKELTDAGVKLGYKEDYLPQIWNNTPEQVAEVQRRLGLKPSFTMQSVIENYKAGIDAGLNPKFTKLSDLAGWYEAKANKALADRKFFDYLTKNNFIQPVNEAPQGWESLDPDLFPLNKVNYNGKVYSGALKAPPDLANVINDYLRTPAGPVSGLANIASKLKNIVLATGIPKTGLNVHGLNILMRSTLSADNPIAGFLTGSKYILNPNAGEKWLAANADRVSFFTRNGMEVSSEQHILEDLTKTEGKLGKYSQKARQLFGAPLFQQAIPALKTQYAESIYQKLLKSGLEDNVAAKTAAETSNNIFGGINTEQLGRSKEFQNIMRSVILAPDFQESGINIGKGIVKSIIHPNTPEFKAYQTFARNMVLGYIAANAANKATSGHYMWENEAGHALDIAIGTTAQGKTRYLRPFGTAIDFLRLPIDVIQSIAKGDLSAIPTIIRNRLSVPAAVVTDTLSNTDYSGQPLLGKDKYGNPMTIPQQLGGIGRTIAGGILPGAGQGAVDVLSGRKTLEEGLVEASGAPIRYQNTLGAQNISGQPLYNAAEQSYTQITSSKDPHGAFDQLLKTNPKLAGEVAKIKTQADNGLTSEERAIQSHTGQKKVDAIYTQLMKLPDSTAKKAYWDELVSKGIMTDTMASKVSDLVKNGSTPTFTTDSTHSGTGIINAVAAYAKAIGTHPIQAFRDIFKGQILKGVSGDAVIVQRMDVKQSAKVKSALGGNKNLILDHLIPLELGGTNEVSNLRLVPTDQSGLDDKLENQLGHQLKNGTITMNEAQKQMIEAKAKHGEK